MKSVTIKIQNLIRDKINKNKNIIHKIAKLHLTVTLVCQIIIKIVQINKEFLTSLLLLKKHMIN
jgi:hypothetical protein